MQDHRKKDLIENQLKRITPIKGKDLQTIAQRLGLKSHTEALEEAITVLLLITKRRRRAFLLEEEDGSILRIKL